MREATEQPLDSAPFRPTAAAAEEALEDSLELTVVVAATSREEQEVKGDTRSTLSSSVVPKGHPDQGAEATMLTQENYETACGHADNS